MLREAINPMKPGGSRFETQVLTAAEQLRASSERQIAATYLALKPLEQAIVCRMLEQSEHFRAYDTESSSCSHQPTEAGCMITCGRDPERTASPDPAPITKVWCKCNWLPASLRLRRLPVLYSGGIAGTGTMAA